MRRTLQVLLGVVVLVSGVVLYSVLRDANWAHSWLKSLLVMLPEVGTIVAIVESHHAAKANELRGERNELAKLNNDLDKVRNDLLERNTALLGELDAKRNAHLQEIARQVQRPQSLADRNAAKLRQFVGRPVAVTNRDNSRWGTPPLIAEVSDDGIVALFLPARQGSQATVTFADCADIEITDIPRGDCPVQIKVNKLHGGLVQLGEITRWEDRRTAAAAPNFERGGTAFDARYTKPGTSDARTAFIYSSRDGSNSFLLETSTGERFVGDNKAVSIRFLSQQVEYLSDGFRRAGMGTGQSPFPLFVC